MFTKSILLVEDNPDDEALALRAFGSSNFPHPLRVVHDGKEAIDYLLCTGGFSNRNPNEMPALIMLDLKLPKVAGLKVLQVVRTHERTKMVPVVILTSSKEEKDVLNAYSLGANSYIRKPIRFEDFVDTIKEIGKYWLRFNELPQNLG